MDYIYFESIMESNKINNNIRIKKNFTKNINHIYNYFHDNKFCYTPLKILKPKDNGKYRDIIIYNDIDNYIQKLLLEYLNLNFSEEINNNVFSYKKGVSTYKAIYIIKNNLQDMYYLKTDIQDFFKSIKVEYINKHIKYIFNKIYNKYKDKDIINDINNVHDMLLKYINNKYIIYNNRKEINNSLQAGTPISAFISNSIIKNIDDYISNNTEIYIRYGDDIIIGSKSLDKVKDLKEYLISELNKYELNLNEDKTKIYYNEPINYLGVNIDGNKIDLDKKHWYRRKKYIKSITNKYKKLININKNLRDELIIKCIREINRKIFTSVSINEKIYSDAEYIFSTINVLDNLLSFEYYTKDRIRQAYTGRNNKSNVYKLNDIKLKEYGWVSLMEMYYIYKKDKDIFTYKVNKILDNQNRFI